MTIEFPLTIHGCSLVKKTSRRILQYIRKMTFKSRISSYSEKVSPSCDAIKRLQYKFDLVEMEWKMFFVVLYSKLSIRIASIYRLFSPPVSWHHRRRHLARLSSDSKAPKIFQDVFLTKDIQKVQKFYKTSWKLLSQFSLSFYTSLYTYVSAGHTHLHPHTHPHPHPH